jgi:hypothetical protein
MTDRELQLASLLLLIITESVVLPLAQEKIQISEFKAQFLLNAYCFHTIVKLKNTVKNTQCLKHCLTHSGSQYSQ